MLPGVIAHCGDDIPIVQPVSQWVMCREMRLEFELPSDNKTKTTAAPRAPVSASAPEPSSPKNQHITDTALPEPLGTGTWLTLHEG